MPSRSSCVRSLAACQPKTRTPAGLDPPAREKRKDQTVTVYVYIYYTQPC